MKTKLTIMTGSLVIAGLVAQGNANAEEHTVKSGESLWAIADKYNTTIEKIQKVNKLDSELIHPNQKLDVLVNGKYTVQKGDTLEKIAKKFDVKVVDVKKLNNFSKDTDLKVGKQIIVEKIENKVFPVASSQVSVAPVQQAPVQQAPVQQAPVQQAPVQQAPVQQAPVQQAPVQQAPVQQAPVQQAPVQQAPVQQAPVQQAPVQQASAPASNSSMDAHLKQIIQRESGGNPAAVNPAGYYGLFQFSPQTWAAVGGTGNPAQASVEEQWKRARILYSEHGAQHWSTAY